MADNIRSTSPRREARFQLRDIHGTPVYTPATSKYTPATESKPGVLAQAYTTDYTELDSQGYTVSGSSHDVERAAFHVDDATAQPIIYSEKRHLRDRHRGLFKVIQSLALFCFLGILLAIPVFITYDARDSEDGDNSTRQTRNLVFYIFILLLTTLGMTGVSYVFAMILPYLFRFIAHYVNPAQKKYWRIFVMLRRPIVMLFAVVSGYVSFYIWFWYNTNISELNNAWGETAEETNEILETITATMNTIERILLYLILWAGAYFLEKILITFLTVHYHYRANHHEIEQSKSLVEALVVLYDLSYTMYPRGHSSFATEDYVIHNGQNSTSGKWNFGHATVGVLDRVSGNFAQAFGVVFGSQTTSHWFEPRSDYAIVGRALQHPASSAALAKRLWTSLVSEGGDALTLDDLKEALGARRHNDAAKYFKIIDENENGDVRLDEMVPSIVEAGKKRQDIYMSMANIKHVVNTLDWMMIGMLAMIMLALVLISQIPLLQELKETIGLAALGISFVAGRTLNEFVQGAIFTILDHPYDVGDVVEIHNLSESNKSLLVVKRISLLYTVFEEVGSVKQLQYANMRSKIKRITNLSRSGKNREAITLGVDFGTSFKDLQLLRQELQKFVTAPENSRDYYPDLGLRVTNLCDLKKLEISISFRHKSNWSNEALRAARSSRFFCAIVTAVRLVPINKPDFSKTKLGDEGKPTYTVMITDTEAGAKRAAETEKHSKKRMDYVAPEPKPEPAADAEMDDEQTAAAELKAAEAKKKAQEKADKEAREKEEEAEATIKLMGIKTDGVPPRNIASSTGVDLLDTDGQSQFQFISGDERGIRVSRRTPAPSKS